MLTFISNLQKHIAFIFLLNLEEVHSLENVMPVCYGVWHNLVFKGVRLSEGCV